MQIRHECKEEAQALMRNADRHTWCRLVDLGLLLRVHSIVGGGGQRDASSISSISSSSASQHTSHYRAPTQPPRVKWFEKSERGRNPRFCERSACAVPGRGSPHTSPCLTFRVSQLLPLCTCIPFPWLVKKKSPLPTKQACQNTPGHLFFVFC